MAHVLATQLKSSVVKAAISGTLTKTISVTPSISDTISDSNVPFEIKNSWKWVSFNTVFDFQGGFAFKSGNYVDCSKNQVIRLGNVKNDLLITESKQVFISDEDARIAEKYKIKENDILITMTGTRGKKDYLFSVLVNEKYNKKHLYLNQRVGCLRCKDVIIPAYAIIVLKCEEILDLVFEHETGTANQGNIGTSELKNYLYIPLPPIEEQVRIVAKFDEIMAKINEYEKLENQLVKLKEQFPQDMKDSLLQAGMMGKLTEQLKSDTPIIESLSDIQQDKLIQIKEKKIPKSTELKISDDEIYFEIPNTWRWVRFGNFFSHVACKALNSKNTIGNKNQYITTSNVYEDHFELSKLKEMYYTDDEIDKYSVKYGDLLVLEGGDVGRSAIWNLKESYCIQNHLHRCRPFGNTNINFYLYALRFLKNAGLMKGKGIAIQGLSAKALHNILVPFPPIEEQQRIVDKLDELLPLVDKLTDLN